jgi:hypothetical protein
LSSSKRGIYIAIKLNHVVYCRMYLCRVNEKETRVYLLSVINIWWISGISSEQLKCITKNDHAIYLMAECAS